MQLSRKADYALRAVAYVSQLKKNELASIGRISKARGIPREFLAKILKDLTRAGILVSYQGVTGGYRLAMTPREITFMKVIEAIDGPIHLNLCTEEGGCRCDRFKCCSLKDFWMAQEKLFKRALSKEHFGKYKEKKPRK